MIPPPNELIRDPISFAEHLLIIQDKARKFVPLRYNAAQRHYLEHASRRDLILKARQLGFSTAIQSEFFRLYTTGAEAVLTMADKQENTDKLRRMAERYYEYLPPKIPKPIRSEANASITVYPQIGSEVQIATAGSQTSGRASTYNLFHGSEVAYWKNAEWVISGALQAIPEHLPDTWVVFESTANGASGWFYDECMAALAGDSEWTLHFYAWWWDKDYQLPLLQDETLDYTEEEAALVDKYNLSPEQIKWRRKKQRDLKERFQQEHPESPMQAFLASGGGVFTITQDMLISDIQQQDIAGGELVWFGEYIEDHIYVMGIDWGQSNDWTVASVFDATDYKQVALLRINRQSFETMIAHIVKLAQAWHVEKIVPEINAMNAAIEMLTAQLWAAEWPIKDGYSAEPVVEAFRTSQQSKAMLVTYMQRGFEDGLKILDYDVSLHEFRAFESHQTQNKAWSYEHPKEGHDDTVISMMLGNRACYDLRV